MEHLSDALRELRNWKCRIEQTVHLLNYLLLTTLTSNKNWAVGCQCIMWCQSHLQQIKAGKPGYIIILCAFKKNGVLDVSPLSGSDFRFDLYDCLVCEIRCHCSRCLHYSRSMVLVMLKLSSAPLLQLPVVVYSIKHLYQGYQSPINEIDSFLRLCHA